MQTLTTDPITGKRNLSRPLVMALVWSHLVFFSIMGLRTWGQLQWLEMLVYDVMMMLSLESEEPDPRITMLWYTDDDIQKLGWPLSDKYLADVYEKLLEQKPRVVGMDMFRDMPVASKDGVDHFPRLENIFKTNRNIIAITRVAQGSGPRVAPPVILEGTDQVGFNDVLPDAGIIRRSLLFMQDENNFYESFSWIIALRYLEPMKIFPQAADPDRPELMTLGKSTFFPLDSNEGGYVGLDSGGYQYMLNFPKAPAPFNSLTLTQLLNGEFDPALIRDKVIVFGFQAESIKDFFYTPYSRWSETEQRVPGAAVHAHAVSQILHMALDGTPLRQSPSESADHIWIWFWCVAGGLACLWRKPVWAFFLIVLGVAVVIGGGSYFAFVEYWWIPVVPPLIGWVVSSGLSEQSIAQYEALESLRRENHLKSQYNKQLEIQVAERTKELNEALIQVEDQNRELNRMNGFIRKTFGRYLSDDIVHQILDAPEGIQIGGERRELTILMADIRGFSAISERVPPETVVAMINVFLEKMTAIILEYEGTIDEILGDALLLIFGAPIKHDDDPERAVACAIAMQRAIPEVNSILKGKGFPEIAIGVGINTGEVIVGNIGSQQRTKYGIVGPNVNLTARIESYTVGGQILISPNTAAACSPHLKVGRQLEVRPKGIKEPITISEVIGIGGKYDISMPPQADVEWHTLSQNVIVRFSLLSGKHASDDVVEGKLIKMSETAAQLEVNQSLESLTNLKMLSYTRKDNEIPLDVYAKVIEMVSEEPPLAQVDFTSIPPEAEPYLDQLYQA